MQELTRHEEATYSCDFQSSKKPFTFSFLLEQFVLDVQFLVEIGMHEGYFYNDPLRVLTLMKSTFLSAGVDPFR